MDEGGKQGGCRVWFVSRHPGALAFARHCGIDADVVLTHAEEGLQVNPGDRVYGTLPYWLAAQVCAAGAEFWCLEVPLSQQRRGQELSAAELQAAGARFVRYDVLRIST